jgi:hypothetical protein
MSAAVIGIDKTQVTGASAVAAFRLGTVGGYDDPTLGYQEFIYGRADGAVTGLGFLCVEATGFDFAMATVTNTAPGVSGFGSRVGAAQAALADNEFGWFQIYGKGSLRTLASAAKGTRLNTTATGGALDDDGTASSEAINGVVLHTATGGAAATNADAMFSYPSVGVTL